MKDGDMLKHLKSKSKVSESHAWFKRRGTRSEVLIVLGLRHSEVDCHCFPRRLYFRRVSGVSVQNGCRGAMKTYLGADWDSNLVPLTGDQLPH
ncbi:hypothetical protein PoB_004360300 [Plakobranchus ocellatus]|uniref:Uncharacterized protein n=1 Tax=Plakobranchus ocellatus TaxID=259542 RepID=A0AAV4BE27_9GAST|nr:hypothetical protein PoB_004360300 [Plakobranchus ocellatus]